jgi:hypothetical protein
MCGENPIFLTRCGERGIARRQEQPRKIGIGAKTGRIQQFSTVAKVSASKAAGSLQRALRRSWS